MKILLLATATNLPWVQAEVQRILRSGLRVTPLLGPISYPSLMDEIIQADATALWVCGHMSDAGIDLGSERLGGDRLAPLLRRFRLVILNSCSSLAVAQTLQRETDAEIIATIREVEDETAFGWGAIFAQALARTGDTALADAQARPAGDNTYIRLAGNFMDSSVTHEEYTQILNELAELRRAVQGSQAYGLVGLTGQIEQLRRENGALRWWLAILSMITLLELFMLVFIASRYVFA
jgi:hypothetical protein